MPHTAAYNQDEGTERPVRPHGRRLCALACSAVQSGAPHNRLMVKLAREGKPQLSPEEAEEFKRPTLEKYESEGNPYYSTARLWDDGILDPMETRQTLALALSVCLNAPVTPTKYGVFRM